ncbi:MAG: hypothetical protein IPI69_08160 [Bacteroidales bacterium]|nr:hypothetical protein [Bacteroidales bacterium]
MFNFEPLPQTARRQPHAASRRSRTPPAAHRTPPAASRQPHAASRTPFFILKNSLNVFVMNNSLLSL